MYTSNVGVKSIFFYLSACVGGMSAHVHTLLIHVHTYTRLSKPSKGLQVCKCTSYIMYLYIYISKHLPYLQEVRHVENYHSFISSMR